MTERLEHRIETLERAITDGDHDLSALAVEADAVDRLETLETHVEDIDDRVSELEAATQALRGYVGNVRSVNTDVEQRAETALAKVESLESALDLDEGVVTGTRASKADWNAPGDSSGGEHTAGSPGHHPDNPADESRAGAVEECTACGRPRTSGRAPDQGLTDGGRNRTVDASEPRVEGRPANSTRVNRTGTKGDGDDVFPDAPETSAGADDEVGTLQRIRNML